MNQHAEVKMALTVEHDLRENFVTGASQAEVSLTHKPPTGEKGAHTPTTH